jgi:glycosyltransferase involved in cell wall biosynthesis
MKYLVILTKQFPYQWREQYVAHELAALAGQFDKVFIYPHDHYQKKDVIRFDLPKGVEVIDLNQQLVPAPRHKVVFSFLGAFIGELFCSKRKWYQIKAWRRFYSIYATQYALGEMLMTWQRKQGIAGKEVLYYSYWMSASALCLGILKRRGSISGFITRAHSVDLYHEDWGLLRDEHSVPPFRCLKERNASRIYPISNHGLVHLKERGVEADRLATRYLGVLDVGLGPVPGEDIFTLVTCSGIDDNKRIHLLGEALSRLNKPARWIHFGDGPLREQALKSVTSKLVHFECRGQTSNDDVRAFYAKEPVHCFVNLSIVEGLPVSIMEAISHGIPVIATAVYGVPEIVINGYNGATLPVQFTNELIDEALMLFMTNSAQMATMRANARTRYEELFNAEKNYNEFAKEIASLRL